MEKVNIDDDPEVTKALDNDPKNEKESNSNWRKDKSSILLLFLLYILQGIPLGLIVVVPFLLLAKGVPYKDQAIFSLAGWPFGLKVLYAPIIDAVYWERMGRRKSWIIPLQYLISIFMLLCSFVVTDLMNYRNVSGLAAIFFILNLLAASQDVAVDGWALTMLSPENVGYASICNAFGQTLGFVLSFSGFLTLESASFANRFRSEPLDVGLVTFPQFLLFWSIIFFLTTTFILLFKSEAKESSHVSDGHMQIFQSYINLWRILKLSNIRIFVVFLLTVRVSTAATQAITGLKLVEYGIPRETLAFFSILLIPLKLLLPFLVAKWTVGPAPMKLYMRAVPASMIFGLIWPLTLVWMVHVKEKEDGIPFWFICIIFGLTALELVPGYTRFITYMGFAAKVSDKAVGGTYMTLINTLSNVGAMWPNTLALWLVDYVGFGEFVCTEKDETHIQNTSGNSTTSNYTDTSSFTTNSTIAEGIKATNKKCKQEWDGYYTLCIACFILGCIWYYWGRKAMQRLRKRPLSTWLVVKEQ